MAAESGLISVLIASSNAMPSQLMATALNRHSRFRVVTVVRTAREVLEAAKTAPLDVALIRATLADGPMSGLMALRHLRECAPNVKAVLLLDSSEPTLVVDAFRAGARGVFCTSESAFKTLCRCVDRVHAGQIWAKSIDLSHVLEAFADFAPMRVVDAVGARLLTKREEDVVRLLSEGLQNQEIAHELNLSEHTIKNHLFHIFDKLGVGSRVEVILYAASSTRRMQSAVVETDEHEGALSETGRVEM